MTEEQVKIGMKVRIPVSKTGGYLTIEDFHKAIGKFRADIKQEFLYVIYQYPEYQLGLPRAYALGITPGSGTSDTINGYKIGEFEFSAGDLVDYDAVEEVKAMVAGLISPLVPGADFDVDKGQVSTSYNNLDGYGLPFENPKHKDWEMGDARLEDSKGISGPFGVRVSELVADSGKTVLEKMVDKKETILANRPEGLRHNEGKPDFTLVDLNSFLPMVEVLEFGAKKYSRDNWKNGGDNFTLLGIMKSVFRHTAALMGGELYDEESGLSHIGHLQCNLMFLGYYWNKHIKAQKEKKGSNFLKNLFKSRKS